MSQITTMAGVLFAAAIAAETVVWMAFLHGLKVRHPRQWLHSEQPVFWQDRTVLSARSMMLYLHRREYVDSLDGDGVRYCIRNRSLMLVAYWFTAVTGFVALTSLALFGW